MKKRFSGPQIVAKLRQADILIGQGKSVPQVCKEIGISQQFFSDIYKTLNGRGLTGLINVYSWI